MTMAKLLLQVFKKYPVGKATSSLQRLVKNLTAKNVIFNMSWMIGRGICHAIH